MRDLNKAERFASQPASTGESAARPSGPSAPHCPECKTQLRDETAWYRCDTCHARYSSSMERGLYRLPDDRIPAPQTSAEPMSDAHMYLKARAAVRKANDPAPAPSYMTCTECGMKVCDHIVKRLAGTAPKVEPSCTCKPKPLNGQHWTGCPEGKVEDIAAIIYKHTNANWCAVCESTSNECSCSPTLGQRVSLDAAKEILRLRPYFHPASQTGNKVEVSTAEYGNLVAIWQTALMLFGGPPDELPNVENMRHRMHQLAAPGSVPPHDPEKNFRDKFIGNWDGVPQAEPPKEYPTINSHWERLFTTKKVNMSCFKVYFCGAYLNAVSSQERATGLIRQITNAIKKHLRGQYYEGYKAGKEFVEAGAAQPGDDKPGGAE